MRVIVVMSTFNGERFIGEQLDSILQQLPAQGMLMVRDDGSVDATAEIVAALKDPRVRLERGPNLGFGPSFLRLLRAVPSDAEMVMLSDQDDVWLPDKIQRAWDVLGPRRGRAVLYCSRMRLVDADLRVLGDSPQWPRGPSFRNALVENITVGCTIALTPEALALVCRPGDDASVYFHDWWIYLVVSALGEVVIDPHPTLLYRQHGRNVIGFGAGLLHRYAAILRFLRQHNWVRSLFMQASHFRHTHGELLAPWQRELLDRYFDATRRGSIARLLLTPARRRQFLRDEILLRALVLYEVTLGRGLLAKPSHRAR
jgi:glycosyltransferase involved in cell wall biosynthesis